MAVVCVRACRVHTNLEIWPFFLQTQGNSGRLGENFEYFLKIRENSKLPCAMLGNGDTTLRTGGGGGGHKGGHTLTGRGDQKWFKMCGRPL